MALAVFAAFYAWRTAQVRPCEPGRVEEKDASGKLVKISRTECLGD